MTISFAGIPQLPYQGTLFTLPVKVGNQQAQTIPININWMAYGAGDNLPAIAIPFTISGNQQTVALQYIRSVYIDNTGSPIPVYIQFDNLYTISAQPFSSGWYPVLSNDMNFIVVMLGMTNTNLTSTKIFLSNLATAPYTDVAQQISLEQRLASPILLGTGGGILGINILATGSSFNNGNMSITGGGGNGATAQATLDQYGRVTAVTLTNGGADYTGQPTIAMTGGQTSPAAFNGAATYTNGEQLTLNATIWLWQSAYNINCGAAAWVSSVAYTAGQQANYGGNIYQCILSESRGGGGNPPPNAPSFWVFVGPASPVNGSGGWVNTQITPSAPATFTATLGTLSQPVINSSYGITALGDQVSSGNFSLGGAGGIVVNNLFGSPYATGFIYLTNVFCAPGIISSGGPATFNLLESNSGVVVLGTYEVSTTLAQPVSNLQGCNIKLDATLTWQINVLSTMVAGMNYNFVFTYSNQ